MPEFDIHAADTYLAAAIDASQTTCELAHPRGPSGEGYPTFGVFWATIGPDDPMHREDVIVSALATNSPVATIQRGYAGTTPIAHRAGAPVRLGTRAGAGQHGPIAPTLLNSWANVGGALATCVWTRHPSGLVLLEGWIDTGASNSVAFTLPAGSRPRSAGSQRFPAVCSNDVFGAVHIDTNGDVVPRRGAAAAISLSGVVFWAGG